MAGYQGYQGYGSPERAKVDRARQMAELLQQGATDTSPKSFWEGAAQLGKAFIARGAMDKAEKAETEYGDNQKKALALFLSQKPFGAAEASPAPQADKLGSRVLGQASARASSRMSNPGEAPIPNVAQMAETLAMTSASPNAAMQSPAPAMTPPPAMAQAPAMAPAAGMAQPQDRSSRIANLGNLLMGPRPQQVPQAPQMDINAMVEQHFATTGDVQGAMALGRELQRQQLEDRRYTDDKNYTRKVDARDYGRLVKRDEVGDGQFNTTFDYNKGRDETEDKYRERVFGETVRSNRATEGIAAAAAAAKAAESGIPDFGDENGLRTQYLGQAKTYQDVKQATDRVKALSPDLNPPEQMALIFSVMKMLDPSSTVRETEYANAQNTTGAMGSMWNYYNKMKDGEFLNDAQVKQFRDLVNNQYQAAEASYGQTLDQYRGLAQRYRMDPAIIQDMRPPGAGPTRAEAEAARRRNAGAILGGTGEFNLDAFRNMRQPSPELLNLTDEQIDAMIAQGGGR